MRITIDTQSGRILEMQEFATEGTLLANAKVSHPGLNVEEREVTAEEYRELIAKQPKTSDDVRAQRRAAYPDMGDALDAIVKGGKDFAAWQAACLAVKAKYPLPKE